MNGKKLDIHFTPCAPGFSLHPGVLFLFLFISSFYYYPQIAPGIEWRKCTWSPGGLGGVKQTQDQSGEEWWYSHKNLYDATGTHTAYVNVGYTSLVSTAATFTAAQQLYNEGSDSPYNPIDSINYNYSLLPEGCSDRDYLGEHRTPPRGNIGMTDLNGNMIYCKPKTVGALEEVIQDPSQPNSFYVVGLHLGVKPYKNKISFIPYNPTAANPTDYFSLSAMGVTNYSLTYGHMYIAKIDVSGAVIWQGLYGVPDYSISPLTAYESESYGYDIIKSSAGNLIATGISKPNGDANALGSPVLLEIDSNTGYLIQKALVDIDDPGMGPLSNTITGTAIQGIGRSLIEIGTSRVYAVGITSFFGNTTPQDNNNAFVWAVDSNFNPSVTWPVNPMRFAGAGPVYYNSNVWEVKYHKGLKQLLIPVVRDCISCQWAGGNSGYGYIYRLDSNGVISSDGINPSPMGPVNAYDLRIGVEETNDNGFVAVSSVRQPSADHSFPTQQESGYLASCPDLDITDWDTDAIIVKYDAAGNTEWSKTFDQGDNRPRVPPPGDLKRQECMYKISQAQDGGFVISGNSSHNFDDNYMAKLYNDCNARNTYTSGPNYELHLTSNTTWNRSVNVIGKVVVHPGVVFNIDGSSTIVRFADSKLTGIETNVTVMYGGTVKVSNGATLASIDPALCSNSRWDGIVGPEGNLGENNLLVYPNPANTSFNLLYNCSETSEMAYTVTDVLGKEVRCGTITPNASSEINSTAFAGGVYFVSIYTGKKLIGQCKLVIVK